MPFATSNPFRAWFCGEILAASVLGFMWAVELPLNIWFCAVWLGIGGTAAGIYFYEAKPRKPRTLPTMVVMENVHWNFAEPPTTDIESFITVVTRQQPVETTWSPQAQLPVQGSLEIHYATYSDDQNAGKVICLSPENGEDWTQAKLLFALHQKIGGDPSLGNATFFEGLILSGDRKYQLCLGS